MRESFTHTESKLGFPNRELTGFSRGAEIVFAGLIGVFAGRRVSDQLTHLAPLIYPSEQYHRFVQKRLRLWFRSLVFLQSTASMLRFFDSTEHRRTLLRRYPWLIEKPHRPYLSIRSASTARANLITAHYDVLEGCSRSGVLLQAALEPVVLARFEGRSGTPYEISLRPAELRQEGELVIALAWGETYTYRLAFTLAVRNGVKAAYIGCLQGPNGEGMRDAVRNVTQDLHGSRPKDVLFALAQVIFSEINVHTVLGISTEHHVHRHWRNRTHKLKRVSVCYDSLWTELGGEKVGPELFRLPLEFVQRPLVDYPSKKRAQAGRKQELLRQVALQVLDGIRACLPSLAASTEIRQPTKNPH